MEYGSKTENSERRRQILANNLLAIAEHNLAYQNGRVASKISDSLAVGKNEDDLKRHVAKNPVAVSLRSTNMFKTYRKGEIYDELCPSSTNPDTTLHCVSVVGYTKYQSNKVWIIKNSWGKNWGDNGFMYMLRGSKNVGCIYKNSSLRPI